MPEQIPEWAIRDAEEKVQSLFTVCGNSRLFLPSKEEVKEAIARALAEQRESIIAGIRRMKYSDRGEGLEDRETYCDERSDYERAMLDEFAEEIIASIRASVENP